MVINTEKKYVFQQGCIVARLNVMVDDSACGHDKADIMWHHNNASQSARYSNGMTCFAVMTQKRLFCLFLRYTLRAALCRASPDGEMRNGTYRHEHNYNLTSVNVVTLHLD